MRIWNPDHTLGHPYGFRQTWYGYKSFSMRRDWTLYFWLRCFTRPGLWLISHPQYTVTGPELLSHRLGFWLLRVGNQFFESRRMRRV